MKRRHEASDDSIHSFGRDPIYCEATAKEDDILYEGSEDEHYLSKTARKLRYEAAAQRFLNGGTAFVLTANLKGPFDAKSGWENPWISKTQRPRSDGSRGKTQTQTPVQKPPGKGAVVSRAGRSDSIECHLPSPESLGEIVQAGHQYLEQAEFAQVQKWRLEVKPVAPGESPASGVESPALRQEKRQRSSGWLQQPRIKRAKTDPSHMAVIATPTRKSHLVKRIETPRNKAGLSQSRTAQGQTLNFVTPSTRHTSKRLVPVSQMKKSPRQEFRRIQDSPVSWAQSWGPSQTKRLSPKRDFCRGLDGRDQDSEDELSMVQKPEDLSPPSHNGHSKVSPLKQIKATAMTTTSNHRYLRSVHSQSGRVKTIDVSNAPAAEQNEIHVAGGLSVSTNDDAVSSSSLSSLHAPTPALGSGFFGESQARKRTFRSGQDDAFSTSSLSSLSASILAFGSSIRQVALSVGRELDSDKDDALSTSSLSSLQTSALAFESSPRQELAETVGHSKLDKDDVASTSSLSSIEENLSPWAPRLLKLGSQNKEIRSSSPLSELSGGSTWSGISERILQISNEGPETSSLDTGDSTAAVAPHEIAPSPYRPWTSRLRRIGRVRSSSRLRNRRSRASKGAKVHSTPSKAPRHEQPTSRVPIPWKRDVLESAPRAERHALPAPASRYSFKAGIQNPDQLTADVSSQSCSGEVVAAEQELETSKGTAAAPVVTDADGKDEHGSDTYRLGVKRQSACNAGTTSVLSDIQNPSGTLPQSFPAESTSVPRGPLVEEPTAAEQTERLQKSNRLNESQDAILNNYEHEDPIPEPNGSGQQAADVVFEEGTESGCTALSFDAEERRVESPVATETAARIWPVGSTDNSTTMTAGVSKEPDWSGRDSSVDASLSRGREMGVVAIRPADTPSFGPPPASCLIPSETQSPKLAAAKSSTHTPISQADQPIFLRPRTPEPEFAIKSFASFMSPSPDKRQHLRASRTSLGSAGHRGILSIPGRQKQTKKQVSWAPLPHNDEPTAPVTRAASPPPGAPMEELPLSTGDKFRDHFYAVTRRAEPSTSLHSQEAGPHCLGGVSDEAVHDTSPNARPTSSDNDFGGQESRPSQLAGKETSQDFLFDLDDIFDEMGDVLKTWNVDNELQMARGKAVVL